MVIVDVPCLQASPVDVADAEVVDVLPRLHVARRVRLLDQVAARVVLVSGLLVRAILPGDQDLVIVIDPLDRPLAPERLLAEDDAVLPQVLSGAVGPVRDRLALLEVDLDADVVEPAVAPGADAVPRLGVVLVVERHPVAERRLGHPVQPVVLPPLGEAERIGVRGQLALGVIGVVEPGAQLGRAVVAGVARPDLDAGDAALVVVGEPDLPAHAVDDPDEEVSIVLDVDVAKAAVLDRAQREAPSRERGEDADPPGVEAAQLEALSGAP